MALTATSVSIAFSDFVTFMIDASRTRYIHQKANPRERLAPVQAPPVHLRSSNSMLCQLLRPVVPEEVNIRSLRMLMRPHS